MTAVGVVCGDDFSILMTAVGIVCGDDCSVY